MHAAWMLLAAGITAPGGPPALRAFDSVVVTPRGRCAP
jgi:hypothetical protein